MPTGSCKMHHDVRLVLAGPPPGPGGVLAETQEAASQDPDVTVLVLPPDPQTRAQRAGARGDDRAAEAALHRLRRSTSPPAMWKGKPVVGSLAGGIPSQIVSKVTGYTVETVEGAAFRVRHLLSNPELIGRMGAAGREHVRRNFLITRHLGDYLALLAHLTG